MTTDAKLDGRVLTREQIEEIRAYYVGDPNRTLSGWQNQVNALCDAALRGGKEGSNG